jgi:L,D-transpeptidase catalytic domain
VSPPALPPWTDDAPLPAWARSVAPVKGDVIVFDAPTATAARRGLTAAGARLPLFGAQRGSGCTARWLLVGPYAWVCGDAGEPSADDPLDPVPYARGASNGLLFPYFFIGRDGASAYARPASDDAPLRELEPGWAVGVVEERTVEGEPWGKTPHGEWMALRELGQAHVSAFHGVETPDGALDFAWVIPERATVFGAGSRPTGAKARFERTGWHERRGAFVRVSPDGAPEEWMQARDLAHPAVSAPPEEAAAGERWIDVDLATQTLVAYDGLRPAYATLVSTGRGAPRSGNDTPPGVHRIWVKILYSTMDDTERDDVGKHYSMEDVPYVQFFDKAVGLHGTYWHQSFGRVKSHGCVNLSPLDARWLFGWTSPRLAPGWAAAYPTPEAPGTLVRVK